MRAIVLATFLTAPLIPAVAQDHSHEHHHDGHISAETDPPIKITINPEVRVSVARGGALPPPGACGQVLELPVKIVNQGFLTAPLRATLVGSVPEGVSLEFSEEPLKGIPEEHRTVRLTLRKAQPVDVTISFRAKNDITDLGGRDRIHLLMSCQNIVPRFPKNAAEFDQMFEEVKNWGRWGPNDQLGAANLITEEKRRQAIALAKLGRVFGLSRPLLSEPPKDKGSPFEHTMMEVGFTSDTSVGFTADTYKITYHGSFLSHFDALCHVGYKGRTYNGYLAKEVYTDKGCAKLGVENLKNGVVTRGILIDIPRLKHLPYLEPGTPVFLEDLEAWEKEAGVKISAGDAIFLRTGQWARPANHESTSRLAGMHPSVAFWLKARGVSFIGSDAGFEVVPSPVKDIPYPLHVLAITALGIAIFDAQDLEGIAETAAELNRWEFLLTVSPLAVIGGTGSPVNSLAIF